MRSKSPRLYSCPGTLAVPGRRMAWGLTFLLASAAGHTATADNLSASEIARVIDASRAVVRRECWQPAVDARGGDGLVSARVVTSLVISASGEVASITASGAEQRFPGLSSCVAAAVRRRKFPPGDTPTTIKVPFLFATQ